jgi:hypothetical protein
LVLKETNETPHQGWKLVIPVAEVAVMKMQINHSFFCPEIFSKKIAQRDGMETFFDF